MMKKSFAVLSLLLMLFAVEADAVTLKRVSVHDPSVVWEPNNKYFYIIGSHRGFARTKDMMSWSTTNLTWGKAGSTGSVNFKMAFNTCATTTVTIGGVEKDFQNFDAEGWSKASVSGYDITGNMWAPDIIWNPVLQKWCMYMSINGDSWKSSIVLLTSANISGPYVYQGPVVISGFEAASSTSFSFKKTDVELALGTQSSLPSRYTAYWGRRWPHCIDPCVFYDEQGKLWMTYGSWSGGIWILELDENTGLRDYNVNYPVSGSGDAVTSDPYFGKRIADGFYSSGEGSYVEFIGGYYFLFISNGGLTAGGVVDDYNAGGYQMRVFRSANPNGPYVDVAGNKAIYTQYKLNFGPNSYNCGVNIFGAYGSWGYMTDGERSQGHNSIIAAEDGRTYLVYHTRFQNGGEGHAIRVHQVFQNQDGWLVAAPFEYTGENVKSADVATTEQIALSQIPGIYQVLVHKYGLDHRTKELCTPVEVTLKPDGTVSGAYTGTWEVVSGTSYVNIKLGTTTYKGVMVEQGLDRNTGNMNATFTPVKVPAFTGLASNGTTMWAYRSGDDPTGILNVKTVDYLGKWYDMQGHRVDTPTSKGAYIQNGKKYILK